MGPDVTITRATAVGTILDDDSPASIVPAGGDNQSAILGATFAAPFAVKVLNANGHPIQGVSVAFTAPAGGASGTFTGGQDSVTVVTDADGSPRPQPSPPMPPPAAMSPRPRPPGSPRPPNSTWPMSMASIPLPTPARRSEAAVPFPSSSRSPTTRARTWAQRASWSRPCLSSTRTETRSRSSHRGTRTPVTCSSTTPIWAPISSISRPPAIPRASTRSTSRSATTPPCTA